MKRLKSCRRVALTYLNKPGLAGKRQLILKLHHIDVNIESAATKNSRAVVQVDCSAAEGQIC